MIWEMRGRTLYPSRALRTKCSTSSKTSDCVQVASNTLSYVNANGLSLPGGAREITVPAFSPSLGTLNNDWSKFKPPPCVVPVTVSSPHAGRTRQKTRMSPFSSWTWLCSARRTTEACFSSASFDFSKDVSIAHRSSRVFAACSFSVAFV